MTFYVDRLEGNIAVVQREDGVTGLIFRRELPDGAREGSVLSYEDGVFKRDVEKEKARRRAMFRRLLKLKKRE